MARAWRIGLGILALAPAARVAADDGYFYRVAQQYATERFKSQMAENDRLRREDAQQNAQWASQAAADRRAADRERAWEVQRQLDYEARLQQEREAAEARRRAELAREEAARRAAEYADHWHHDLDFALSEARDDLARAAQIYTSSSETAALHQAKVAEGLDILRWWCGQGERRALATLVQFYVEQSRSGHPPVAPGHDAELLLRAAEYEVPDAPAALAWLLVEGDAIPADHLALARWMRVAAEQGDVAGQICWSWCLREGAGVARDPATANEWSLQAASAAPAVLQRLGLTSHDLVKHLLLAQLAEVAARLGAATLTGRPGIPADAARAYRWIALAADLAEHHRFDAARDSLAARLETAQRIGVEEELAQAFTDSLFLGFFVGRDAAIAKRHWQSAARLGSRRAQQALGALAEHVKKPGPRDRVEAYVWYALAASQADDPVDVITTADPASPPDSPGPAGGAEENPRPRERTAAAAITAVPEGDPFGAGAARNRLARKLRKADLAFAQSLVGQYLDSSLAEPRPNVAAQWFKLAAENDNPDAQFRLAEAYASGRGLAADPARAAKWYQRAARNGSVDAQLVLGIQGLRDHPAGREFTETLALLRQVAQGSNPRAQFYLGQLYERHGTSSDDLAGALRWYLQAAAEPDPPAEVEQRCRELEHKMTAAQRADALEKAGWFRLEMSTPDDARFWFELAAEAGSVNALFYLAESYAAESPGGETGAQALEYYRRAARLGARMAMKKIGESHAEGHGVTRDPVEATVWFWAAGMDPGDLARELTPAQIEQARHRFSRMLETGEEIPRDPARAAAIWQALAEGAEPTSFVARRRNWLAEKLPAAERSRILYLYGGMLRDGSCGCPKDETRAQEWIRRSADGGCADAQFDLGRQAFTPGQEIVAAKVNEAIRWLRRAAEQNHAAAQLQLAQLYLDQAILDQAGEADQHPGRARIEFGVPDSRTEAERLLRRAANQGLAAAQFEFARQFCVDRSTQRYSDDGWRFLRSAAKQGHSDAQVELANLYLAPYAPWRDPTRAYVWLALSDEHESPEGKNHEQLAKKMAPGEVERAQALLNEVRIAGPTLLD